MRRRIAKSTWGEIRRPCASGIGLREIALARLNHVASVIVNVNHSHDVIDCGAPRIQLRSGRHSSPVYHSPPNGSASEARSTSRLFFARAHFVKVL
jgi:hypothetical protein